MDWGMNVKELRSKFGLSQQQLANLTGIPKGRINAWEQKGIKPKYDDMMVLEKAAAILEKQVSQELDGSNGKQTAAGKDEMYEGIKKIIEGAIDYVLVPKSILMENYRLLPVEQLVKDKDEFLALVNLPLKGALDDHRDTFVLASFLGPRIGDWKQFDEKNLIVKAGVTYFTYVQEKTGHICSIPVHSLAQKILDKRGGKFPPQISEQNLRYAVKRIWEMVAEKMPSLKHRVVVKVRDNQPVYAIKHTVFSPHTARRIFASQLFYGWFTKPMPASYCMHYTGHKKESSFLRYINAKTKEIAEKALEYFDYPNMKVSG